MFLPTPGHPRGTGAMVSQFVVLTAAQNFPDRSQVPAPVYEFTLGPGITARATEVRVHPDFETVDGINLAGDIALVALDRDEVRNWPGVSRYAIRESLTPVGALGTGIGFGELYTGLGSGVRRSGSFSVTGYVDGADQFGNPIPNAFIEVTPGNELNQMFCLGDQGGPLFFEDRIAGVTSFRFVATCEEVGPGYYVSLHRLTDWIRENLNEMDPVLADFQADGDVDGFDLKLWRGGFGESKAATHMQGDADGDLDVDGADFLAWQRQLGNGRPAVSTNAPVPEPSTFWLVTAAAACICRMWRGLIGGSEHIRAGRHDACATSNLRVLSLRCDASREMPLKIDRGAKLRYDLIVTTGHVGRSRSTDVEPFAARVRSLLVNRSSLCALGLMALLSGSVARAAITLTNDVIPSPPAGDPWDVGGALSVGETLNGAMTINAGSDVTNTDGFVANMTGSTGTVTVNGAGSTWTNSGELRMGNFGMGTLNITGGGAVSVGGGAGRLGNVAGGMGIATVDGSGSTLTATNFILVGREGSGTLNIQK